FAQKLYIADWLPLEMQRPALAHEIEHALQDQHFDLKRFASPIKDDGDKQLAHSALVEGDGTAVMLEFQAQAMGLPTDQLAELVWRIWFQTRLPQADAEKAAAGWGGDRIVAYADGDGLPALVILSAWDTEGDAREAADASRKVVAKLAGKPEADLLTDDKG